ncbi:MAG: cytochrome C oxidase subunit IV family protein [Verrucomicrobia bacterium]|nr:cytochrome C oxidase subunit IV family protein [Verrucomicrobiota bacterium]
MSDHSHEISKHVRIYFIVGIALLIGTVLTVAMNSVHFDSMAVTIAIALFIACVKGFLVAGYFMHLMSEKKMIYSILGATAFFFAGMMYLTIFARDDTPLGTLHTGSGEAFHPAEKSAAH